MKSATAPKQTSWLPVAMSVHMPQSLRTTPSTEIVPGNAGLVITRSDPRCAKVALTVVVWPAVIVTCWGAGCV